MRTETEFASTGRSVGSAYQGLARWAGVSLETVVEHAEAGRLGELVERRQFVRPRSGSEALRQIEGKRYAPGDKPRSPSARIGELRAMRTIWRLEEQERRRRSRDPEELLAEIFAKRVPDWWGWA